MRYLCHWDTLWTLRNYNLGNGSRRRTNKHFIKLLKCSLKIQRKSFQFSWLTTVSIHKPYIHEITISRNMHNCNLVRQRWRLRHSFVSTPFIAAIFWSCLWLLSTFLHKGLFMLQTRRYENVRHKFRLFWVVTLTLWGGTSISEESSACILCPKEGRVQAPPKLHDVRFQKTLSWSEVLHSKSLYFRRFLRRQHFYRTVSWEFVLSGLIF
jgi:hypothetical protein